MSEQHITIATSRLSNVTVTVDGKPHDNFVVDYETGWVTIGTDDSTWIEALRQKYGAKCESR